MSEGIAQAWSPAVRSRLAPGEADRCERAISLACEREGVGARRFLAIVAEEALGLPAMKGCVASLIVGMMSGGCYSEAFCAAVRLQLVLSDMACTRYPPALADEARDLLRALERSLGAAR
ncbi:MAG: hypothetical protein HUK26_07900 [Duodenibacillus sp.]|nr:hypothetical protein [Duodenibacillus sp.]